MQTVEEPWTQLGAAVANAEEGPGLVRRGGGQGRREKASMGQRPFSRDRGF